MRLATPGRLTLTIFCDQTCKFVGTRINTNLTRLRLISVKQEEISQFSQVMSSLDEDTRFIIFHWSHLYFPFQYAGLHTIKNDQG